MVDEGDEWGDIYIRRAGTTPQIGRTESVRLAMLAQAGDRSAEMALFNANLRRVVSVAERYVRNRQLGDLLRRGETGLRKAIKRFDESKGFAFSTYATWWIKQAIVEEDGDGGETREPRHPLPSSGSESAAVSASI